MKSIALFIFFLVFQIIANAQGVKIEIIQDNQVVKPIQKVYHLSNKEFSIKVISNSIESFLVGATFTENVYESALGLADVDVEWFENTGMAESNFNTNKEIFISDEAPSYWFFTDKNDHRFDRNAKGNANEWVGTRTISRFNLIDENKIVSVKNNKNSLYVYGYTPVYDEEYNLVDRNCVFNFEIIFSK